MQHSEISHALLHLLICSTFQYTPRDKDGAVVVAGRYAPGHKKPLSTPSGERARRCPGNTNFLLVQQHRYFYMSYEIIGA